MQMKGSKADRIPNPGGCCRELAESFDPGFFKALCEPSRWAIVGRLAEKGRACTVSEMASCCPVDISVVSRHLATLRRTGIVTSEKRGREVLYRINTGRVVSFLRILADRVEQCCPRQRGGRTQQGEMSDEEA